MWQLDALNQDHEYSTPTLTSCKDAEDNISTTITDRKERADRRKIHLFQCGKLLRAKNKVWEWYKTYFPDT